MNIKKIMLQALLSVSITGVYEISASSQEGINGPSRPNRARAESPQPDVSPPATSSQERIRANEPSRQNRIRAESPQPDASPSAAHNHPVDFQSPIRHVLHGMKGGIEIYSIAYTTPNGILLNDRKERMIGKDGQPYHLNDPVEKQTPEIAAMFPEGYIPGPNFQPKEIPVLRLRGSHPDTPPPSPMPHNEDAQEAYPPMGKAAGSDKPSSEGS